MRCENTHPNRREVNGANIKRFVDAVAERFPWADLNVIAKLSSLTRTKIKRLTQGKDRDMHIKEIDALWDAWSVLEEREEREERFAKTRAEKSLNSEAAEAVDRENLKQLIVKLGRLFPMSVIERRCGASQKQVSGWAKARVGKVGISAQQASVLSGMLDDIDGKIERRDEVMKLLKLFPEHKILGIGRIFEFSGLTYPDSLYCLEQEDVEKFKTVLREMRASMEVVRENEGEEIRKKKALRSRSYGVERRGVFNGLEFGSDQGDVLALRDFLHSQIEGFDFGAGLPDKYCY